MFSLIHAIFLDVFIFIYPYYHSNLVSYLLILLSCVVLLLLFKKFYIKLSAKRGSHSLFQKAIVMTGIGLVGLFTIWFVFIHFQSFLALP